MNRNMRNALVCGFATLLLIGPLISQTDKPEPFSFRDDRLGMTLENFKANHLDPGVWKDEATGMIASHPDSHSPPSTERNWKWLPTMGCETLFEGVITRCKYDTTVAEVPFAHVTAVFVEGKLAVISVAFENSFPQSPLVGQGLVGKLGPPKRIIGGHSESGVRPAALRWDNGVSVVEFQEKYCGSSGAALYVRREEWSDDVTEILRGIYCEGEDVIHGRDGFIWYVHKSLSNLAMTRWEEAIEEVKKNARSEPFSFNSTLEMNLEDFKARHPDSFKAKERDPCKKTAKTITQCDYIETILGIRVFATAVLADDKLAVIHLQYLQEDSHFVTVSGVAVPVDIKQALISKFGPPEVIRGYGDSTLTGDDRRALLWDDGVSAVEYQHGNCISGNQYERITKILQRRYCEKTVSAINQDSIWYIHKALSGLVITRQREADEDARKKAISDL